MKKGLIIFAGSVAVSLITHFLSPLRRIYDIPVLSALIVATIGAGVLFVGLFIGYLLDRKYSLQAEPGSRSLFSLRVILVFLALLAAEFAVIRFLALAVNSSFFIEFAYYLVLFAGGAALARWCSSRYYVAPWIATFVLAAFAALAFVRFVSSSGAKFQYGPERWLFALQNLSGQLSMLPLDVAVTFTAWYLFSRRRNAPVPDSI